MKKKLSTISSIVFIALFLLAKWGARYFPEEKPYTPTTKIATAEVAGEKITSDEVWATVAKVIDGDTVELTSGEKLRYIGVDTPETVHPKKRVQCFGKEASTFNKELVTGKRIRLVKDVSETDRYGRLLRYVYLENGMFVNELLIQQGFARASTFPPDVAFSKQFAADAEAARLAGLGLWAACK